MEKIIIVPERVRGLGNVLKEDKRVVFSNIFSEHTVLGKEVINGREYEVNSLNYVNSLLYFTSYSVRTVVGYTETITGMVKDENDDPVSNAEVSLIIDGEVLGTANSNNEGVVSFSAQFGEGIHDLQLSYNNIKSGKVSVTCFNPDTIIVEDVWITKANTITISATVEYNSNIVPNVPVNVTIGDDTNIVFTNNHGIISFEFTGKGYDSTIQLKCGTLEQSLNVHDSILCLHDGELMISKNYAAESRPTGPGTTNAYMEWQGDVFKLTPTKENSTGTANYVNSKFYYKLKEVHWIDETTVEVVDNDVSFAHGVVEFTYMGGTGNLPLNFYAWKNNDGTDPYVVLRFNTNTGKYWSSCMQNGTIVQNMDISGSLKVNDKFRIEFDDGIATVYKNGVVLTTLTYDSEELYFGFIAAFNGSSMYKDFNIQTVPQSGSVVDSVTLSANKNVCLAGEHVLFSATVRDENNNPLSGKTVAFKNGATQIGMATTNSSGVAQLDYVTTSAGTLSVTATSNRVTSESISVRVKNNNNTYNVSLVANPNPATVGETINIVCTVTDADGDPVPNRPVIMSNHQIGTTNSEGKFTQQITFEQAGTFSVSMNVDNKSSNVTINVIEASAVGSVDLVTDKSILSYADSDSCTLTATVYDNGASALPIEGETVYFKTGEQVIGSDVTDENGEATCTMDSSGYGDVSVIAEVGSVSSDPVIIEDCIFYNATEKICTSGEYLTIADLSNMTLPNKFILSVDFKTNYESRIGLFSKNNFSGNPNYSVFIGTPSTTSMTKWYYGYRTTSTTTTDITASPADYHTYTLERDGNTFRYTRDGSGNYSKSVAWFNSYQYVIGMLVWGTGKEAYSKNIKLKAL